MNDSTSNWHTLAREVQSHPAAMGLLASLALVVLTLLVVGGRRVYRRSTLSAEQAATLVAAAIATGVSAQGMYTFFQQVLGLPTPLTLLFFAFLEVMVISSALRARASMRTTGAAGVDGIAMWVLTSLSGILAATDAHNLGTLLIRLTAPLVAAWGWERSMALERKMSGEVSGLNWRISPQRLLVQWGLADPTDRSAAEVAIERRLADLARAADGVRAAQMTNHGDRGQRRAMRRLQTAIDRASEDGIVLGDPEVRDRLRQHLEGRFSAYSLPEYKPATDWAAPAAPPTTGELPPAPSDLFAELEREFARRAAIEPARAAREDTDRAELARATDRAPRAEGEAPRAIDTRAPFARAEQSACAVDDSDTDRAPRAEQVEQDAPRAAHMPSDQVTDRAPIAAREQDQPLMDSLDGSSARDRRAVVSIVRPSDPARGARADRAPRASDVEVEGALARAVVDRAPRAEDGARVSGLYARAITRADAEKLARAVIQQRLSKQPVEVLVLIYEAVGQGQNPTSIGKELVQLPHATVIRAIKAAESVAGPRPID